MSFSKVDIYTNELEKVGKVEYEIYADSLHIEAEHPLPSTLSDYMVAFVLGRPVPGNRRVKVTIELLDGDSE